MWIDEIKSYKPINGQEENDKKIIVSLYDVFGDSLLTRDNEVAHLTSSSMILNKEKTKVLMVFHNIYNSYSWTGGHNDNDPDFLNVALKEAREETGLKNLELIKDNIASIEILPVNPHIKRGKFVSGHLHLNVSYLFEADEKDELRIKEDENQDVKWIDIKDLDSYISLEDKMMLDIYHKLIGEYE